MGDEYNQQLRYCRVVGWRPIMWRYELKYCHYDCHLLAYNRWFDEYLECVDKGLRASLKISWRDILNCSPLEMTQVKIAFVQGVTEKCNHWHYTSICNWNKIFSSLFCRMLFAECDLWHKIECILFFEHWFYLRL